MNQILLLSPPRKMAVLTVETDSTKIRVRLASGGTASFEGRLAWAMRKLMDAGRAGLTTADLPAGVRWSAYVRKLRLAGVDVRMDREKHSGEFSGLHGRYYLGSPVVEIIEAEAA
jgi:hypothetical protein